MPQETKMMIRPYEGVGPVNLGMTRKQVREAIGGTVEAYYKSKESTLPTDAFDDLGIHVFYKMPDVVDYISLSKPAAPTFQDENLMDRPYEEIRDFFLRVDPQIQFHADGTGFYSRVFGIGVYSECADDAPEEPVEEVCVFERGYYD